MMTKVKTPAELRAMRESGRMLAEVLKLLSQKTVPGLSTAELAQFAKAELKKLGGQPAFLGYQGFPDILCVSLNDEVVHGIPSSKRVIQDGDIVSLDFGVSYKGMITDAAVSVIAGEASAANDRLVTITKQSLDHGISKVKNGARIGDISHAIQAVLDKASYGIVRDLVGHGVGHELHEEPNVPNYGHSGTGSVLKTGMTIAIEPMATLGGHRVYVSDDGWTVKTWDSSLAAHFEHTVLVTEDGVDILTQV